MALRPGEEELENLRRRQHKLENELRQLAQIRDAFPEDVQAQARLSSSHIGYLTVRVAGYLESSLELIVASVAWQQSGGNARNFAVSFAGHTGNIDADRLRKYVQRLGKDVIDRFEAEVLDATASQSLNSLRGIRNAIAHGDDYSASIASLAGSCRVVDDVINWLLREFAEPTFGYAYESRLERALTV